MIRKFIIIVLVLPFLLYSEEKKTLVVVMDLFGQHVDDEDLTDLTDVLEKELVKTDKFDTISRSRINEVLEEYGVEQKECTTVPWLVRIGKKLGVEKVVSGSVINRGTSITSHIKTVNVAKQEIDKSATVICKQCSIDDFYIKKMRRIARILAGLEKDEQVDDSLFTFNPGPLIKLEKGKKDADISTKMGNKLFDGMWEMKSRKNDGVGIFLFGLGSGLFLIQNILWLGEHPETMERVSFSSLDVGLAFLSIPFFLRAKRFGKGLSFIELDTVNSKTVEKGIKCGINIPSFDPYTYQYEEDFQSNPGFILGGFFQFNLTSYFALQPELLFAQKRFNLKEEMSGPVGGKLTLNYFDIPIFLKYHIPLRSTFIPNIKIGIVPSFLISAKRHYTDIQNNKEEEKITDINKFDFKFNYGFDFEWEIKKGVIILDIRFEEGLKGLGEFNTIPDQKIRSVSFLAGYSF